MTRILLAYLGSGVAMALLDGVWLAVMAPRIYRPAIEPLMAARTDWRAAVAFYLIYVGGVVALAVLPALREGSAVRAVLLGAILGFVAYATYDLTNKATLNGWPWRLSLIDMAWGTALTAAAALAGYLLARQAG